MMRDEAIALCKAELDTLLPNTAALRVGGIRLALEALEAAGVFVPAEHVCGLQGFGALGDTCPACGTMSDKLDAAGIR